MSEQRRPEPGEPFRPTEDLVDAVRQGRVPANPKMVKLHRRLQKVGFKPEVEDLAERISSLTENLFANRARRAAAEHRQEVRLTQKGHLDDDVCCDLVEGLALDGRRAPRVLVLFQEEWSKFFGKPQRRWWGYVRVDESELLLQVDIERASQSIDFADVKHAHGTVTR